MQTLTEILITAHPRSWVTAGDLAHYLPGSDDARYALVKRAVACGAPMKVIADPDQIGRIL